MSEPQSEVKAFVMMPFATEFDDVYDLIQQCVRSVDDGIRTIRLDQVRAAGRITDDLVQEIETASLCIADVTGANPNVMWEVGFAAALRKPTIAISQLGIELPFDVKDVRTVMYERAALSRTLKQPLTDAILQTLKRYSTASSHIRSKRRSSVPPTIAVTGSMDSLPDKVRERLGRILEPYLGKGFSWYVGSFGVIDEVVIKLLTDAGERGVTVVGYSSYDISGEMLQILENAADVSFLDASSQQAPLVAGAPSERDVVFAARADLVIVAWNGVSEGTGQLLGWLTEQGKDHVLCFVPPTYREPRRKLVR